jgi:hypothetical protein
MRKGEVAWRWSFPARRERTSSETQYSPMLRQPRQRKQRHQWHDELCQKTRNPPDFLLPPLLFRRLTLRFGTVVTLLRVALLGEDVEGDVHLPRRGVRRKGEEEGRWRREVEGDRRDER